MAVEKCIQLINDKKADVLMKGLLNTSDLLKGVIRNENKQNNKSLLSHCAVFELDTTDRLLYITDIGMNISPNVDHKEKIINNTVKLCNSLGINNPKVAVVCAVEKINEKMSATLDAQELVIRNINKVIEDCVVSGPFALDNAVSVHSAKIKDIEDMYAGKSDILLMPNIESGNILYKALNYFTKCKSGGLILGASIPIVLTSRSDSMDTKLNSILLAIHYFVKGI
ncbi:MAG: phosphate acyltransferase [Eubacteriaceae bacterium]